jgi:hypothetical protein
MPDPDFVIEILVTEVVVNHLEDCHIFCFPIMPNGTVSLNRSRIEPNPKAKRAARRYLSMPLTPPGPHSIAHRRAAVRDLTVHDLTVQGPRARIDDVFRRQRVLVALKIIFAGVNYDC